MRTLNSSALLALWRYRYLLVAYVLLLGLSTGIRLQQGRHARKGPGWKVATLRAVDGAGVLDRPVEVAYKDVQPPTVADPGSAGGFAEAGAMAGTEGVSNMPVVLLLHGSPIQSFDLTALAEQLATRYRVILPDLPGFGRSTRRIPDYSIKAHARYARQLLDALDIRRVHVVAYSMGGGVALHLNHEASDRVASIVLMSSIGAQELELLGNYELNHALHGLQLGALWIAATFIPHMGYLDTMMLNLPYARNFYDSDQRPLREYLRQVEAPVQIIHGRDDIFVVPGTADEHHRIVPQSELHMLAGGHLLVFRNAPELASLVIPFIDRVEQGTAVTRQAADPERVAAAHAPFDPASIRKAAGIALVIMVSVISFSTLISEDLACIGAGLMAANGVLGYAPAALAAFAGIFMGDILLFAAGKYIGRPALRRRPFRWFFTEEDIEDSTRWFSEKGPAAVLLSRFVPGSRLPTYFTAGMLHGNVWKFLFFFFIAGVIWAPLLVWVAMTIGGPLLDYLATYRYYTVITVVAAVAILWILFELVIPLFSFRGRRLLLSAWRRKTRWEFWPRWVFYPPIVMYVLWLGAKHRGLTVFTAVNPAIPDGGFPGESKYGILKGLAQSGVYVAHSALVPSVQAAGRKLECVQAFLRDVGLGYPIVAKPDVGQRGVGVAILRSEQQVVDYFMRPRPDTVIQEFVPGFEFGLFYYRHPDEERGRIFSVTEKRFPVVTGDGKLTLEHLILADDRAVCMAHFYLHRMRDRLAWVPRDGERVQLVEIGNHCRGTVFYDGAWILTPELEAVIDGISHSFPGFYFGRYDVRTPSIDDFRRGRNFQIIELNGVTAEATHIYNPGSSLFAAYRTLAHQWRVAFEIGAHNRDRGCGVTSPARIVRALLDYEPALEA
ncbi:MAG: alpha/beta fold hydrolase [bacterium]